MGVGRGGKDNNNNVSGLNQVPSSSKKMIQNLKEIVNCPEAEIYAMLKECNMDPNEAVNRLLSQGAFHEVKSKREKKKENKDVGDSKVRGMSNSSTRGGRGGADRYSSRSSTLQYGTSDSGASRGKPTYKKEHSQNGPTAYSSSVMGMTGINVNRQQLPLSDSTPEKPLSFNAADTVSVAHPSSGYQSAWSGMPGQVSMADIVKMGRPQGKVSNNMATSQQHVYNQPPLVSPAACAPHDFYPTQNYAAKVLQGKPDSEVSGHVPPNDDDWPLDEDPPVASVSSTMEPSVAFEQYGDPYDSTEQQFRPHCDDIQYEEDDVVDDAHASYLQSNPASNQNAHEDSSGSASGFDNDLYQNIGSYQVHHREVEDAAVSSVTNNFQGLSLQREDEDSPSEEEGPAVKIPDHLQVQSAECTQLSFGSFGSGMNAPFSGSFGSRPVKGNEEEAALSADAQSVGHSEARNPEYYEDEHLRTTSDVNTSHRMAGSSGNFDAPSVSQVDMLKQEAPEVVQANQYSFPSSTSNYAFENSQQLNPSFANSQAHSQMQGLPSLSGVMPYSNSLPSTLLNSNIQPLREAELAYSPFPISQSMASKYNNSVSSINGPTASMAEALKNGNFSVAQQSQNPPGGSSISGGAALPQHLAVHPYSQPSMPMGHFAAANMIGYPFLPQNYTYMPSAFQQAFAAGNNSYPQSLAGAMLPQYKNSGSVSSLPQAAAVASGYGGFGNSNSIPNNFPLNPPSAPAGPSVNYDDLLSSQYKDASHLLSLQQGPGSRTMSGVPGSTYYNSFQGQNQQPGGFRQSQQPSQQHYGPLSGYPNFYHSQAGLSLDHQQQQQQQHQMTRDGSLSGSQGQQPKQNQQIWQNSY